MELYIIYIYIHSLIYMDIYGIWDMIGDIFNYFGGYIV